MPHLAEIANRATALFAVDSEGKLAGWVVPHFADQCLSLVVERSYFGQDGAESLFLCDAEPGCEERCKGEVGRREPITAEIVAAPPASTRWRLAPRVVVSSRCPGLLP